MGATSELGPIEPSVQNVPCSILITDEFKKGNFVLHMAGVYALAQTKALAKKLLQQGMMKGRADGDIDETIGKLASRDHFFSHGSVINHAEAKQLGLSIEYLEPHDEVWKRLWLLYCMYDSDCRRDRYVKVFEGPSVSTSIVAAKLVSPASSP